MARHRRRRHRRNGKLLLCKSVKGMFKGKRGKRHRRKYSGARKARKGGRRRMSAGFKRSGNLMKRVWSKHRSALMKMSPKRRFKAAWAFARKMK